MVLGGLLQTVDGAREGPMMPSTLWILLVMNAAAWAAMTAS